MKWYDALVLVIISISSLSVTIDNSVRRAAIICLSIIILTIYVILNITALR